MTQNDPPVKSETEDFLKQVGAKVDAIGRLWCPRPGCSHRGHLKVTKAGYFSCSACFLTGKGIEGVVEAAAMIAHPVSEWEYDLRRHADGRCPSWTCAMYETTDGYEVERRPCHQTACEWCGPTRVLRQIAHFLSCIKGHEELWYGYVEVADQRIFTQRMRRHGGYYVGVPVVDQSDLGVPVTKRFVVATVADPALEPATSTYAAAERLEEHFWWMLPLDPYNATGIGRKQGKLARKDRNISSSEDWARVRKAGSDTEGLGQGKPKRKRVYYLPPLRTVLNVASAHTGLQVPDWVYEQDGYGGTLAWSHPNREAKVQFAKEAGLVNWPTYKAYKLLRHRIQSRRPKCMVVHPPPPPPPMTEKQLAQQRRVREQLLALSRGQYRMASA